VPARFELNRVAVGGALGAGGRYELLSAFPVHPGRFPLTTAGINVGGAFLLGVLLEWLARHRSLDHWARWMLGVGGLGAFTTFSAFAVELALLARDGHALLALGYAAVSAAAGVGAALAGLVAAGWRGAAVPSEGES
jgi:CrcB protein